MSRIHSLEVSKIKKTAYFGILSLLFLPITSKCLREVDYGPILKIFHTDGIEVPSNDISNVKLEWTKNCYFGPP